MSEPRTVKMYRQTETGIAFSDHPISEEEWTKYHEAKAKGWVMLELDPNGWAVVTAGHGITTLPPPPFSMLNTHQNAADRVKEKMGDSTPTSVHLKSPNE